MKIVIYNIGYTTGLKGTMKEYFLSSWRYFWAPTIIIKRIISFLKKTNADVICLLETDVGSVRTRFQNHAKMIAKQLLVPFHHHGSKYHPTSWYRFVPILRKHHEAVFSKLKGNVTRHFLKSGMGKQILEFRVGKVSIFMVHLGVLRSSLRKRQMEELTEILKECDRPYLVCGDFNIFKGIEEVKGFVKKNKLKLVKSGLTFPSFKPKRQIDLIMACKSIKIKATGVYDVLFSDHLPIWVEIEN